MGVASVFAIFAGTFYWFPKMFGRMLHEGMGKANFYLTFPGVYAIFVPMTVASRHARVGRLMEGIAGTPDPRGASRRASFTGLLVLLASTTMIFAAFTSAFVVRRGTAEDWVPTPWPPILFANTAALLLSSAALELARRALRRGARTLFNRFWTAGTILGLAFLAGQWQAWRELSHRGYYMAANPGSAFFYLLTAAHAIHLAGGMCALVYVDVQALRLRLGPGKRTAVEISTLFWHFLDGLWLCLLAMFYLWD